ncbi:MAG TPA: DUF4124 domain-containing protein, partial [Woeseiaceae bacterium]|nr:DUF4124 domain-containing protein [Woeseiaceae bacterium]
MFKTAVTTGFIVVAMSFTAFADEHDRVYKLVDEDGNVYFSDKFEPEQSELPKELLNEHGVTVDRLEGRKTEEQLAAEAKAKELQMQKELQVRADKALLATYLTVEEIVMHR